MHHSGPRVFEAGVRVLFNADHWALNPPSYLSTQKEVMVSLCFVAAVGWHSRVSYEDKGTDGGK